MIAVRAASLALLLLVSAAQAAAQDEPAPAETAAEAQAAEAQAAEAQAAEAEARAREAQAVEARSARLEATLVELADHTRISAGSAIVTSLVGGTLLGFGVYVGIDGAGMGDGGGRALTSAFLLAFGGSYLASGIHAFDRQSTDELRLARFRSERSGHAWDRIALSRFEGELAAEAAIARYVRVLGAVQSIGVAAGGAGGVAIAIAVDELENRARVLAGVLGGAYLVLGTWQAILGLSGESEYERIVHAYQARDTQAAPSAQVRLVPAITADAVGAGVAGTF